MSTTIIMPQLGESVAEGVIGKWLKQEGDPVAKDEAIVEVITDKVNAEIPSPVAGVLEKIAQPEGATVAVGEPIGVIGEGDTAGGSAEIESGAATDGGHGGPTPAPSNGFERSTGTLPSRSGTGSTGAAIAPAPSLEGTRSERVRSSPLVRRLAEQHAVDLAAVAGTGIGGRVSKHDILSFVEHKETSGAARPAAPATIEREERPAVTAPQQSPTRTDQPTGSRPLGAREELIPVSPLRKMIADRMVLSKFTIPHAVTNSEVDMTKCAHFREIRKEEFRQREGVALSFVAFVIKATVESLKEFPMVNAEWTDAGIILKHDININVAVDAPEGLTTPVIHHADEKSLAGLSKSIYDLAMRGRNKKMKIEDMQGGTFTVNNTGALGSVSGVSIINYPQSGILSAAAIIKRPVVLEQDGQDVIAVRSMMNLGFSFDHRLLDGGYAAAFVNAVKTKLEAWPQDYPVY